MTYLGLPVLDDTTFVMQSDFTVGMVYDDAAGTDDATGMAFSSFNESASEDVLMDEPPPGPTVPVLPTGFEEAIAALVTKYAPQIPQPSPTIKPDPDDDVMVVEEVRQHHRPDCCPPSKALLRKAVPMTKAMPMTKAVPVSRTAPTSHYMPYETL